MAVVSDPRFETKDPRFDVEYRESAAPPKRNPWTTCLIGCLVFVVLGMLFVAVAGFWVWRNWRDLAATGATEAMNQMIDSTDLPADERHAMKLEVQRVAGAFRAGRMSNEQLARLVQEVANSPLLTLFVVSAVEKQYLEKSGLSDEEKAEGRTALRRFVRGVADEKIAQAEVNNVLQHIAHKGRDGSWQLREKVSDEELKAALADARRAANEAEIPEQPERVDASAEFKRIVDEALSER